MSKNIFKTLPLLDKQLKAAVVDLVETLAVSWRKHSNYLIDIMQRAELIDKHYNIATSGFVYYLHDQINRGVAQKDIIKLIMVRLHNYYGSVKQTEIPPLLILEK